jgi:hypothetical protein
MLAILDSSIPNVKDILAKCARIAQTSQERSGTHSQEVFFHTRWRNVAAPSTATF